MVPRWQRFLNDSGASSILVFMVTRPMLCAKLDDPSQLRFPALATPKIDGIRCLKIDGAAVSRSFKPIRNRHIRWKFLALPDGIDGELVAGTFHETQSA